MTFEKNFELTMTRSEATLTKLMLEITIYIKKKIFHDMGHNRDDFHIEDNSGFQERAFLEWKEHSAQIIYYLD
jgi:hypothetical protein